MVLNVSHDGFDQLRHTAERAASDALLGDFAKPPLDHVEPRTRGWGEMQVESRVALEPCLDSLVFVGGVVVDDQVQVELGRRFGVDLLQETDEFLMAMARHAIADHGAVEHAQGGEQGGGAVARVVVALAGGNARPERQDRLDAVERLDLALLVHTQDKRLVRGIEIQSHHIGHLFDESLVAAEFERLDQVRLEIVHAPDAPHAGLRNALGRSHGARAPMRRVGRRRVKGRLDHGPDLAGRDARLASRARSIFLQTGQSQG